MKDDITIDLKDIDITGNVLDISIRGNNIIPEIIKGGQGELEKDLVLWGNRKTGMDEAFYDRAYALFSLGTLKVRKSLESVIMETSRVLKTGGKLLIWELDIKRFTVTKSYSIKVILPQNRVGKIHLNTRFNPLRTQFVDYIELLEKYNFKVILSSKNGNTFFIEAEKDGDVKVEDSFGIA